MPLFPGNGRDKAGQPSLLKTREEREAERRKRRRELGFAAAALAALLPLIFVQLRYIGSGSLVFFVLFNLNSLLLLGILFVVLRNALKLILERKRRIIGSRLRTRLVLSIVGMTIIPCLIMFLVAAQFVKLSVDFWFKTQVEGAMDTAADLAGGFLASTRDRLRSHAEHALRESLSSGHIWGGPQMESLLEDKKREYGLYFLGLLDSERRERNLAGRRADSALDLALAQADWGNPAPDGFVSCMIATERGDFLYAFLPARDSADGWLALGEYLGAGFQNKLERVSGGVQEYKQLRSLTGQIKGMLYLTLTIVTALITLSIVWFAFRAVKAITDPIATLVNATARLAEGEENVRVEDNSSDEMSILVASFNSMADEITRSHRELTESNSLLSQQNLTLVQQRQYVETVLDNLAAGILSFDAEWNITTVNRAACRILERGPEDILGRNMREIITRRELADVEDIARALTADPSAHLRRQLQRRSQGRELSLLVTVAGLSSPDNKAAGAVAVFEDVTELEKMQRLAAWREVAQRIAHEIKNPLTPIKLSAQRLEKKFGPLLQDQALTESTQLIVRQVEQLQDMVQEFSAFAKMPDISLKPGRLAPLLGGLHSMFKESFPAITWELELPEELPEIFMDEAALQRAFLNILTNAAEALEKAARPKVGIRARLDKERGLIRVEISDNGPEPLCAEEMDRIFEPYFSRKKSGTGLGLAIVRSIITAHRGYARAASPPEGGTLISVELPLS